MNSPIEEGKESSNEKENNKELIKKYVIFFSWYVVFLFIIPKIISKIYSFDTLRKYFPTVDLLANVFATVFPQYYFELYSSSPFNLTSFISTNFISLLALMGVSWNGIHYYKKYKDMWFVIKLTLIMFLVTYLLPTQIIPFVIKHLDYRLDITSKVISFVSGLLFVLLLVSIETFFVTEYITIFN